MLLPLGQAAADGRLLVNLISVHFLMLLILGLSFALRWLVTHSGNRLAFWAGSERLKKLSAEATRHGHTTLFWLTVAAMAIAAVAGVIYHFAGRDARVDFADAYGRLTAEDFVRLGMILGGVVVVGILAIGAVGVLRRLLPILENYAMEWLGHPKNEETLRHWFHLFDAFAIVCVRLGAIVIVLDLLGVGRWATGILRDVLLGIGIVALARLLTVAGRATTHVFVEYGTAQFGPTSYNRYWERIHHLVPLGQRCFETAVYITAAWLFVSVCQIIKGDEDLGPRIVGCIGIFFGSRVVIELLQVLLNEAFGMYKEDNQLDQKGRTLVPLLQSLCQYVIYFGSFIMMLEVLHVSTTPFLAGAGILGLGVGLGAQSLVTDVVSGFFILFEGQYLVGDYISIGDAAGTVEEVSLRVTKVRDGKGKLYIIPNGQIKGVVSYSKGYVNAVVDVKMPSGSDLEGLFRAMKEAGRRLKSAHREVLADTQIHGLVEWGPSDMTIRAVTKVEPGTHGVMQSEYRRLLKQVFDEKQAPARTAAAA
jgi:moderate conductance mechanosensitive channel